MVFEKSLTAMVKGIRAHRGKETEYISACQQEIQKEITSKNLSTKSMAILKLAYLNMLGYDMSWATFGIVEVMSHNKFPIKRPGYLASSICFTNTTDVGLLTINLFKKDFGSKSQYESGMAISCLSSICTPEISRDIITDLMAMLSSSRAYLRKKTVLCLYRIFVKDPPALRTCFPKLKERLGDEDQGVLTATINTFLELARKNAKNYLSLVPQLYHILVNTTNNWLSIKLLKLFQLLCPLEPRLPSKMVEPLTNLLSTTKAQSVEYEAIRTTIRTMPEGTALSALAVEKLQNFLNSSDRNLRYLGLELFREVLTLPGWKEKYNLPDLHAKVLQSIEESDTTARKIALQMLDEIVTPPTFVDAVKKLMEFAKSTCPNDELLHTILRMGARDKYELVEDFAWYLLVLADISRNVDSPHAAQVAEQFVDISARVAGVRPYAVTLALSLLEAAPRAAATGDAAPTAAKEPTAASVDISPAMVGACAWVVGEYQQSFEEPVAPNLLKAARVLLVPKHIQGYEASIQAQCVWAAAKMLLGAPACAPGAVPELHALLTAQLPAFAKSTHVDVSERAAVALRLVTYCGGDPAKVAASAALCEEALLPVAQGAQAALPLPDGLDLEEPFFEVEEAAKETFAQVRADPTDPYALASTYKDDLGFLAAQDTAAQHAASPSATDQQASMFYLQTSGGAAKASAGAQPGGEVPAAKVPDDPLEAMRERLAAQKAAGGTKYTVAKDEVGARPSAAPAAAQPGALALPATPDSELLELHGRLWSVVFRDSHVGVYACVRTKNAKKQLLRVDLRCERIEPGATDIALKLPAGVSAQEADISGALILVKGELPERPPKVKTNLSLAPFLSPTGCQLACKLSYSVAGQSTEADLELALPATAFLSPAPMSEDDVQEYVADRREEFLNVQSAQAASMAAPGRTAEALFGELPSLVSKCAGLCHFYGIQQSAASSQNKGLKFLLVSRPPQPGSAGLPGQVALPQGALIVCLCAVMAREEAIDVRITVKSCRQDVCDEITAQLTSVFRELVEGRLSGR